jgi:hypothetical protein
MFTIKRISLIVISIIAISCNYVPSEKKINKSAVRLDAKISEAFKYCKENNMNTDFCILIDMSIHSGKNRLTVWDFNKNEILKQGLVSHGCGLEATWASDETKDNPKFSNTPESHLSSLGKYAIGDRAWSNWGINIKYWLKGLELSNNNAKSRVIVLHGWEFVTDEEVFPNGTIEGWGCPSVSNKLMKYLDDKLRNEKRATLFWIYK